MNFHLVSIVKCSISLEICVSCSKLVSEVDSERGGHLVEQFKAKMRLVKRFCEQYLPPYPS